MIGQASSIKGEILKPDLEREEEECRLDSREQSKRIKHPCGLTLREIPIASK